MAPSKFYTSLAVCLLSLSFIIQSEASKPSLLPSSSVISRGATNSVSTKASANAKTKVRVDMNSALLMKELYPRWMHMDIEGAPDLMQALFEQAQLQIAEICKLKPEEMNYENTFDALEKSHVSGWRCQTSITHLSKISDSSELRAAAQKVGQTATAFNSSSINNEALWKNLKIAAAGDWVTTLSPEKKRHIQRILNEFKNNGANLAPAQKKRCHEILKELDILQLKFAHNIPNELIVHRIAVLRHELAQLLGFENFASYKSTHRMMGSEPKMRRFIEGMVAQLKPAFEKECAELHSFIFKQNDGKVTNIHPSVRDYYFDLFEAQQLQFNKEELRTYFPQEQVREGMFQIFEQLLNIRFKEKACYCPQKGEQTPPDMAEVWHPDVRLFEIFDASSKKHLGSFYLDLFQRDKKSELAWMGGLRMTESGINSQPQLATLVCNFSSKNALLYHNEVQVLFHEMGHVLHLILSETELIGQVYPYIAKDFKEFPSMLAEHWAWNPECLDIIARHHETGAKIPAELKDKLMRSRYFMPATKNMEQLSIALLDLELHSRYDTLFKGKSLVESINTILKDMRPSFIKKQSFPLRAFTHCISYGYESGYYSYKWGEVLAADAFSRFLKDGVLNANTGKLLRESVLSKGDSAPAMVLFKNFMGREPNIDALLELQGILPAKEEK